MAENLTYMDEYRLWCDKATDDGLGELLSKMDEQEIKDAFYRNLEFGTAGLRGIIGPGTNRMNVYTVARASQGVANYLIGKYGQGTSATIGYDSRIKSDVFSKVTAAVFAANGINVNIWKEIEPVPAVSFATRRLSCEAGIMITASHNPSEYNGYKVYGPDGCQITTEAADAILSEIEKVDIFDGVKKESFEEALAAGRIKFIDDYVMTELIEEVKGQSCLFGDEVDKGVKIVYSPLNGTGAVPVMRALRELGYENIIPVREQFYPDGSFPTCPTPNPENKEALELAIQYAEDNQAELVMATDPDCDRIGIAVKDNARFTLFSGNEVGILLINYICSQRKKHATMPDESVMVKTVVTTDLAEKIAESFGVKTVNVLTGFKYIGEQIGLLESRGLADSYILGFEESYGYLTGSYVRDKDAINAACLIAEMFAYYKSQGMSLIDVINGIYKKFGYYRNHLKNYRFEGAEGLKRMKSVMDRLRTELCEGSKVAGLRILKADDYLIGVDGLPRENSVKYILENDCSVVVRPSGTEPKMKLYVSAKGVDLYGAEILAKALLDEFEKYFT